MKTLILAALIVPVLAFASEPLQQPLVYDVSTVTLGSSRLETLWAYAVGKWSDGGDKVAINSTEIRCYQRLGFCEEARAFVLFQASVMVNDYDILRWDQHEIIAVDSTPICVVNTLRFDFDKKRVTLSSTSKGEPGAKIGNTTMCKIAEEDTKTTAFLTGKIIGK